MYQFGMKLANLVKKSGEVSASPDPDRSKTYSDRAKQVWRFITATGILDLVDFKVVAC